MAFRFVDLFAGIGGFHAALSTMGGRWVYACEIDPEAAAVYLLNWGLDPLGDITIDANDGTMRVPPHDVLAAGFPCQPFSKSGAQRGMEETRGSLYWNILKIIQAHKPTIVVLENVCNLAGPRHLHEWQIIIETLRAEGYCVSETPAIFSPHLLPPDMGGRPQLRERVFITATFSGNVECTLRPDPPVANRPVAGWDPASWDLESDLPLDANHHAEGCELTKSERLWIDAWNDFVELMWVEREGRRLPGFPLWADSWIKTSELRLPTGTPAWKADFLRKKSGFYTTPKRAIDRWVKRWGIYTDAFPPSRRKLEWQAQNTPNLWSTVMHLRPSGIRAKAPTYVPALVAITQTTIVGSRARRLSPREAAKLQSLPGYFDCGNQHPAATYKQLGNGVSVAAVWHVLRSHAVRDEELLRNTAPELLRSILESPANLDRALERQSDL